MRAASFIKSRQYRWYILAGVITALIGFGLVSRVAEALPAVSPPVDAYSLPSSNSSFTYTNPNGGELTITATAVGPTSFDSDLCNGGGRKRPNFRYRLSDTGILLGPTTSTLTYDLDLGWRDCGEPTLKYAIYSPTYCRLAGHYGAGAQGNAFDCVKYIHNASNNDALGCAIGGPATPANGGGAPTFNPCVEPWFNQGGIGWPKSRYGPESGDPAALGQEKSFNDLTLPQVGVMGLGKNTTNNNSRQFTDMICQYWAYNSDLNTTSATNPNDDDCKPITFNISWTYWPPPSYDLSATVTDLDDTFMYYTDAPTTWGARVNSAANMRPAGIGNHAVDIWRIVYPGAPPAWSEGTITAEGGLCAAVPGYSSCDRVNVYGCPWGPPQNCGTLNAAGQYWAWNYSGAVGPYPVGTNVCYISRVTKPTYTSSDGQWKGSRRVCSVSAKKPRTQFVGNDVRVVGNIRSSYFAIQGNNYGSWVEYGAFSSDVNMLLGSGAGLRNGSPNPASYWNGLTFTNRNAPNYGGYTSVPQDSAHGYFSGLVDAGGGLNQANPATGVYTVGSGSGLNMPNVPNGRSVVIRSNGTIRITGNINVPNSGVANANGLSQVVIVANTILIDEGVTNVDAWLVTPTNSGTIDTCYRGGDTTLNSNICASQLTVNGPIYTHNLKLRRTAGSNPPGPNELKQPAEKFNLRPDAQLWAFTYANKGDFAQTDYVQELPPRY